MNTLTSRLKLQNTMASSRLVGNLTQDRFLVVRLDMVVNMGLVLVNMDIVVILDTVVKH